MRLTFRLLALAGQVALPLFAGAAGCNEDDDPVGARALWEKIHAEGYRSFRRAPGYDSRKPARAPHGKEVEIYVNKTIADVLDGGMALAAWPEGALIVKDGWDGDRLHIVAAMEKRPGGWFWVEWDGGGGSKYSGKPDTCTGCHSAGADFVRAFPLP
jgi:hypothetical protein